MPVRYRRMIYRRDLQRNPKCLFIFGDNLQRAGMGGQAQEMRGEPNAVGVVTKKYPTMSSEAAFFSDKDYAQFKAAIAPDLKRIKLHLDNGGFVVCPEAGIGTDRASLPSRAPKCFVLLHEAFSKLGIEPPDWKGFV